MKDTGSNIFLQIYGFPVCMLWCLHCIITAYGGQAKTIELLRLHIFILHKLYFDTPVYNVATSSFYRSFKFRLSCAATKTQEIYYV